jgi:hypothetical protein
MFLFMQFIIFGIVLTGLFGVWLWQWPRIGAILMKSTGSVVERIFFCWKPSVQGKVFSMWACMHPAVCGRCIELWANWMSSLLLLSCYSTFWLYFHLVLHPFPAISLCLFSFSSHVFEWHLWLGSAGRWHLRVKSLVNQLSWAKIRLIT